MRIGIEAFRIFRKNKHGMDIVALETIKRLQYVDQDNTYFLFCFSDQEGYQLQETENLRIIKIPRIPSPLAEQFIIPLLALKYNLDILHSTGNTSPLFLHCKRLITLHDIIYLEKKDQLKGGTLYQRIGKKYRKFIVPKIVKKADCLVTVSENERSIITAKLPELAFRLKVIQNAFGSHFMPKPDELTLSGMLKYKVPAKPYIFFLGNTDPKKNTVNVLKAYHQLRSKGKTELKLVIADLSKYELNKLLHKHHLESIQEDIHITNYIRNEDLPDIYNRASIFLYPSLRESFGLPILEAMACGTPVITSGSYAMPETAGDAAMMVNPESPESIANAIEKLSNNKDLIISYKAKGFERVKLFSWNSSARQLVQLYHSILSGSVTKEPVKTNTAGKKKGQPAYTN